MKYFARILHDKSIEKKTFLLMWKPIESNSDRKKYKIKHLWRRFINDKTLSAFTISLKY